MLKVIKRRIADSDRARRPDFSIPEAAARDRGAALHHEEAARQHREAAKLHDSGQHEKASHHALLANAHHLQAKEYAKEVANAQLKNRRHDTH